MIRKFQIVLFTCIFISKIVNAQTGIYHPLPESNALWIGYRAWGADDQTYNDYTVFVDGDTTIGSYTYRKLYENKHTWHWPPFIPETYSFRHYVAAFRQDIGHKKVYLYISNKDTLAYDFNLQLGDTLPQSYLLKNKYYVDKIDSILVGNQYRKKYVLSIYPGSHPLDLIEGVGSTFGLLDWMAVPFEGYTKLYCAKENDAIVWSSGNGNCTVLAVNGLNTAEEKITIDQNPFSVLTTLRSKKNLQDASFFLYNVSGQLVKQVHHISGNTYAVYRDQLPAGAYVYYLKDDTAISSGKLFIMD